MPDAHQGYGLPIGGVLALKNAVSVMGVGVDIACRMKMSIFDLPPLDLKKKKNKFVEALQQGTAFGKGVVHDHKQNHPVMDENWDVTNVTADLKNLAWLQLGSSGSGNHFVEVPEDIVCHDAAHVTPLNLKQGEYVAVLSHSGSRGPGNQVAKAYHVIAQQQVPKKFKDLSHIAWLDLDTEAGQEYWEAMQLMGKYSAANHDVIHKNVSKLIGEKAIAQVENHHNFAWKELHSLEQGDVIVHRKGATPAGPGVFGVIPGSMGDPGYVVRGRGNEDSLYSASHGAGRQMSRKQAKDKFTWNAVKKDLEKKGIDVLSAGADESPGAYKNIDEVMAQQEDLVEKVARFDPKIVRMD
jgi:tRNA-splicing ligase RtcB